MLGRLLPHRSAITEGLNLIVMLQCCNKQEKSSFQPNPKCVYVQGGACQVACYFTSMTICPGSASTLKMASLNRGPHWVAILGPTVLMDPEGKQPYYKWSLYPAQTSKSGLLLIPLRSCYKFGIKNSKRPLHRTPPIKALVTLCAKPCLLLYTPCILLSMGANLSDISFKARIYPKRQPGLPALGKLLTRTADTYM